MKRVEQERTPVEKAKAKVVSEEEGLGKVEKELEGVTSLIEAHRAETDRRERRQSNEGGAAQEQDVEGVLVGEADSAEADHFKSKNLLLNVFCAVFSVFRFLTSSFLLFQFLVFSFCVFSF